MRTLALCCLNSPTAPAHGQSQCSACYPFSPFPPASVPCPRCWTAQSILSTRALTPAVAVTTAAAEARPVILSSASDVPCSEGPGEEGVGRSRAAPGGAHAYLGAAGPKPALRRISHQSAAWVSTAEGRGLRPHVGSGLLRSAQPPGSSWTIPASSRMTACGVGRGPHNFQTRAAVSSPPHSPLL